MLVLSLKTAFIRSASTPRRSIPDSAPQAENNERHSLHRVNDTRGYSTTKLASAATYRYAAFVQIAVHGDNASNSSLEMAAASECLF